MNTVLTILFCTSFATKCFGLPTSVLFQLVSEIKPKSLIYLGDITNNLNIVDFHSENLAVQLIDNLDYVGDEVLQALPQESLIVLQIKDSKNLEDIWLSSRQSSFLHTVWIIVGPSMSMVKQAVNNHIKENGSGFIPQAKLFFLDTECDKIESAACAITQIVGNGMSTPIYKVI